MQFKLVLVLVAIAALCVGELEAARDKKQALAQIRNKRFINNLINGAKKLVENGVKKVKEIAEKALKGLQNIEGTVLSAATKLLNTFGVNVDLVELANLAKGELAGCVQTDSVKEKAIAIKDDFLSCAGDVKKLESAAKDISGLVKSVLKLPQLLSEAINTCKNSKDWFFTRVVKCGKALANAAQESNLISVPSLIMKHLDTATSLAINIKTAPVCLSSKLSSNGPTISDLVNEITTCAVDGVSSKNSAAVESLKAIANFAKTASGVLKTIG